MPASFFLVTRKIMLKNPHISDFKQALKLIDNTTSKMTKKELEECMHKFARTLPEEQRDWFVSLISGKASKTKNS